jgi:hypothetical protein
LEVRDFQGILHFGTEKTSTHMETDFHFNAQGLLVPAEAISADLGGIKQYFVDNFPNSKTRAILFSNLENYISQLQNEVFPWFEIWVDGSFVTKKENPNDIDVVLLLDFQVYDLKIKQLEKFYSFSLEKEGIDAYIVPVFPEGHHFFEDFERESGLWHRRFTENRQDGRKGFLKISLGKIVE